MKSSPPALSWALAAAVGLAAVACQHSSPAPSPSATASASPAASLPPGHPALGAESGALPPGHPPMGAAGASLPPGHAAPATGPSGPPVSGQVTLSAGLQARAAGAKALYVIARKAGTRDIVAVKRVDAPSFPAAFELSAGDAMVPGSAFSGPFDLTARLSKSGDAIPAPGDLEGSATGVAAGAKGVALTLDTVRQ